MGCVASLPMYDVSTFPYCTNPYHCAFARFLEHEPEPDEDAVDIVVHKSEDKRVYHLENLTITELCSNGFRELRQQQGITDAEFFFSLVGEQSLDLETNSNGGSYFSRTHDYKYVVKEIKAPEVAHLQKMSASLFQHWENNPNSLLNRIYAAFSMREKRSGPRHFVVIENSFPHEFSLLKAEYDLKGAKGANRKGKEEERTLKDLDFDAKFSQGLVMSSRKSSMFSAALEEDTSFLRKWKCTDYSLLISVYKDNIVLEEEERIINCEELGRARFCIIDFLREFDNAKRRESTVKNIFRSDSSVQNPEFYSKRFMRSITPMSLEEIQIVPTTKGMEVTEFE